jgi:hypothetical protein
MKAAIAFVALTLATPVVASESGRQILDRRKTLEQYARWWDDRYQRMNLVVVDPGGSERRTEIEVSEKREKDLRQKSLVVFTSPSDKAGIALLGHTKLGEAAAQWLYLPEFRRVRQVGGSLRFDRFSITDFTPHDLDLLANMPFWSEEDARSNLEGSDVLDGVLCHRIELLPQPDYIKYGRILLWLDTKDLVPRQVELYETPPKTGVVPWLFGGGGGSTEGQPLRRFRQWNLEWLVIPPVPNFQPILPPTTCDWEWVVSVPIAHHIEVQTVGRGSRTRIEVEETRLNEGLDDLMFASSGLDRIGK